MRPVRRADKRVTFICRLSWNMGASISWNPQGLSRPVMGLLYLYVHYMPTLPSGSHKYLSRNKRKVCARLQIPETNIFIVGRNEVRIEANVTTVSPPSVHTHTHFTRFLKSELKQMWLQCRHQVYTHFTRFLNSELKQMWLQCRHQVNTHFTRFLNSELKQMWLQCRHQVYTPFTRFLNSELKQMWLQCRHKVYTYTLLSFWNQNWSKCDYSVATKCTHPLLGFWIQNWSKCDYSVVTKCTHTLLTF